MSTHRGAMAMVARRARAYFAPVERTTGTPATFDPAVSAAEVSSWADLGWVENLRRTAGTRIEAVRAGANGAAVAQVRTGLDATIELDFMEWGKLQIALSGCGPNLNEFAMGTGGQAVAVLAGSSATELLLADTSAFSAGDLAAVDVDYTGHTGYVGSGVPGAYVKTVNGTGMSAEYVRRVTLNVARVNEVRTGSITLDQPLLCGVPPVGAKAQKVIGFTDREGGSFMQEWSARFEIESENGGRVCFYYPRLQPAAPAQEASLEMTSPLSAVALHATFRALPYRDGEDGEQVLCYRSFIPAANAPVY